MNFNDLENVGFPSLTEPDYIQLGSHLEANGIMQKWLANKIERVPSWVTGVLQGEISITDEMKKKIEEALSTTNFKFKNQTNQ